MLSDRGKALVVAITKVETAQGILQDAAQICEREGLQRNGLHVIVAACRQWLDDLEVNLSKSKSCTPTKTP